MGQRLCRAAAARVPAHSQLDRHVHRHEYFEDFLASDLIDTEEQRAIYRSYWHFAQVGIALAARDLHAINNHVKIFVSIRKEMSSGRSSAIHSACSSRARPSTCTTRARI
jgi:hypothetical protein